MNAGQIIIGVQFSIISIVLLSYDTWSRKEQEKTRKQWQTSPFFPSWSHARLSCIFIASNLLVWFILFTYSNNIYEKNVSIVIVSILILLILIMDLLMTVCVAARFLMLKYGKKRNPFGYAIFFIALILFSVNWILMIISLFHQDLLSFTWSYSRYSLIMFIFYLSFSILLEYIYFHGGYVFVFANNSTIASGIYGFLGCFVRPFFRSLYCIIKYVVVIIIIISGNYKNKTFYFYVFPFLMEIWLFFLFFARRKNRPNPSVWIELKIWRPFVEFWWRMAVKNYKQRNENEHVSTPRWKDLTTDQKEESLSLRKEDDDTTKKAKKHGILVRTVSQHADI